MHIHLKEAIYNQELFDKYVRRCIECGLTKVVFLDHGNRISSKHTPVLFTQNSINSFNERIYEFRKSNMAEKIKVIKGIEIDYSHDLNFRKETFDILNYGNFEWIVGAIHSMKFENYKQYLEAIIDMLNNYRINVKKLRSLWRNFWGSKYRIYEDGVLTNELLIYHRKIYLKKLR